MRVQTNPAIVIEGSNEPCKAKIVHQFQYNKFSYEIDYDGILNLHILERK